jgi:hypothetical protein
MLSNQLVLLRVGLVCPMVCVSPLVKDVDKVLFLESTHQNLDPFETNEEN